jgi:hypothetical protein
MGNLIALTVYTVLVSLECPLYKMAINKRDWYMEQTKNRKQGEGAEAVDFPVEPMKITTNPAPYIFVEWIRNLQDYIEEQLREESVVSDSQKKAALTSAKVDVEAFFMKYQEVESMVQDGLIKARVTETYNKDMYKFDWSVGKEYTILNKVSKHFLSYLLNEFKGNQKVGAPPKTGAERQLQQFLNKQTRPKPRAKARATRRP